MKLIEDIENFEIVSKIIDDLEGLLTDNRIFKQRNVEIGIVSRQEVLDQVFWRYVKRLRCSFWI